MTTTAAADFRRKLRAVGISLNEERNMAIHIGRMVEITHCVVFDRPYRLQGSLPTDQRVACCYASEIECQTMAEREGGTVYTFDEIAKALEIDGIIAREREQNERN